MTNLHNIKILVVGSGARENAIVKSLHKSVHKPEIYCFGSTLNPDIINKSAGYISGDMNDHEAVKKFALENEIQLAIVGPDNQIAEGIGDTLLSLGIKVSSATKAQAQLEWSKTFTRDLLAKYNILGSPLYKSFDKNNINLKVEVGNSPLEGWQAKPDGVDKSDATHNDNQNCDMVVTATDNLKAVRDFINSLNTQFVIKADGLCGGKGVKVQGDHFTTVEEGLEFCQEIIDGGGTFLIEEKLIGQEFSFFTLSDGEHLADMSPIIQDHKRAYQGDRGPNTGGMGTYSDANHLLPFLGEDDKKQASEITRQVAWALKLELNQKSRHLERSERSVVGGIETANSQNKGFTGIFYGGFMKTKNGVKLIEYNARFGDPEAMNLLALLENDFVEVNYAMATGTLDQINLKFKNLATVCKYVVPLGYPENPIKGEKIDISELHRDWDDVYFASVDSQDLINITTNDRHYERLSEESRLDESKTTKVSPLSNAGTGSFATLKMTNTLTQLTLKGSRAIAICCTGQTISQAEEKVELIIEKITGPLFHRPDIGKAQYIQTKVDMMNEVLS